MQHTVCKTPDYYYYYLNLREDSYCCTQATLLSVFPADRGISINWVFSYYAHIIFTMHQYREDRVINTPRQSFISCLLAELQQYSRL